MDDYAGRVLADRYRLPLPPVDADAHADAYDLAETRAFDTYSGQEVLVRQVPLPEFVDAEVLDGEGGAAGSHGSAGRATRRPAEPVVRRAIEAAQAAAQIPDHPLLDQVFDVFAEAGSLWIVSERIEARPLAALLAERPLNPYRAAEIGADVLTALRALHAHGWVHRNITARTVLVCDDGRVVLTGLAVGAAEEALCGYAPVPDPDAEPPAPGWDSPTGEDDEDEDAPGDRDGYGDEDGYGGEDGFGGYGAEGYGSEGYGSDGRGVQVYGAEAYGSDGQGGEEYGSEEYGSEVYASDLYEVEVYEETDEQVPYGAAPAPDPDAVGPDPYGQARTPDPDPYADVEGDPDPAPGTAPDVYGVDPYGRATPAPPAETQPAAAP
ncbi:protein kinase, partial [Streptomyces sp. SR27]|uniref:protein kinase n=1 Tax=Streptomyces sp. SR27 TaxID=3076630 RepID=UPI00295BD47F